MENTKTVWLEHRDKKTNRLESIYLLDTYGRGLNVKYEIKFQFSEETVRIDTEHEINEVECYILTTAVGNELPHCGKYDIPFEGYYYTNERLVRVYFSLDKAKEEAEKLCKEHR